MPNTFEICIDANEPDAIRPFWQAALGYTPVAVYSGAIILTDPEGRSPTVWFQKVPERKTVKNRFHLDVSCGSRDEVEDLATRLDDLGGSRLSQFDDFIVVADPEGNEVCLIWPDRTNDLS